MNVFEDLVVELKQENLLESTVIEAEIDDVGNAFDETEVPNVDYDLPSYDAGSVVEDLAPEIQITDEAAEAAIHDTEVPAVAVAEPPTVTPPAERPNTGSEFFKKKAVAEVSALQMVEHVITGVEREYQKIVPKPFDDFEAKKALSAFLNTDASVHSEEHAVAEYNLMRETEAWCSALALRDREVPVSSLRQYCERSRPALSSQALLALGRFYRNLPYSEGVRSKFDFVITRLFSRAIDREKRVCLFTREEMMSHINTLYSDWSSVPLYAVDEDDSKVMLTALSFEDLAIEAENAGSFDQLIESDFFGRLRMFKESIAELFYAPQVTVSAIDCNIRIGNRYVDLIDREREKLDSDSLRLKYGEHDLTVSEVTGKTLELPDLLRQLGATAVESDSVDDVAAEIESASEPVRASKAAKKDKAVDEGKAKSRFTLSFGSVNKWVIVFSAVMIATSIGLYLWANYAAEGETPTSVGVRAVDVSNTALGDHIKAVRISGDMYYAQMNQSWDVLPKEKRLEILQNIYKTAQDSSCTQVTLISLSGKNAGFASATRLEVVMP